MLNTCQRTFLNFNIFNYVLDKI